MYTTNIKNRNDLCKKNMNKKKYFFFRENVADKKIICIFVFRNKQTKHYVRNFRI